MIQAGYTKEDGPWKRVSDLLRLKMIEDTGRRLPGDSGRDQRVLIITELGKTAAAGAKP